jgi:hypothetical protein
MFTWGAVDDLEPLHIYTDGTYNFGSGPDIGMLFYDEFDGGTTGARVNLTATINDDNGGWTSNDATNIYDADTYVVGGHSARIGYGNDAGDLGGIFRKGSVSVPLTPYTQYFSSYALKVPAGYAWPSCDTADIFDGAYGGQVKTDWNANTPGGTAFGDFDLDGFSPNVGLFNKSGNDTSAWSHGWFDQDDDPLFVFGSWNRFSDLTILGANAVADPSYNWTQVISEGINAPHESIKDDSSIAQSKGVRGSGTQTGGTSSTVVTDSAQTWDSFITIECPDGSPQSDCWL